MAESGGQPGNNNPHKGRLWREAIKRAMAQTHGSVDKGLISLAKKLLESAESGDPWALKEIGDRFDGKAAQAIVGGDDDSPPVKVNATVTLRKP